MIVNEFLTILIVIIIGYFLGSIPTAYLSPALKPAKTFASLAVAMSAV